MIPYSRQSINSEDVNDVCEVLKQDYITCGPEIYNFEYGLLKYGKTNFCTVLNSGTAALHAAMFAIDLKSGEEVIIPVLTFVATANCIKYMGGKVVLCDVDNTGCIDVNKIEKLITSRTKAIIAVDYAGQSCQYIKLKEICSKYRLKLISDACHSMTVNQNADITCFSFHPVKHITTGEGGACLTNNLLFDLKIKAFRSHGRAEGNCIDLGYNYRMTDFQAVLGQSQLKRIDTKLEARKKIALVYDSYFKDYILEQKNNSTYHLYVLNVNNRDELKYYLLSKGIGCQIHYVPIYEQDLYRQEFKGNMEFLKNRLLSIPLYPGLSENEQEYIIREVKKCLK